MGRLNNGYNLELLGNSIPWLESWRDILEKIGLA
jgi:hypothetical protein